MSELKIFRRPTLLGLGALISGWVLLQVQRLVAISGDPDRYYHLALARLWQSSKGVFLRSVPQVEGLGWGDFFPDKEPLFHLLTGIAYRVSGEIAVLMVPVILAAALMAVLAILIRSPSEDRKWSFEWIFLSFAILSQHWFLVRISMLRPHTLALVLFFVLFLYLEARKKWGVFVSSGVFALSYHAIYVPLALVVVDSALRFKSDRAWRSAFQPVAWSTLGLALGTLASPSFPGNLLMTIRHLQIALFEVSSAGLNFGNELYPWTTSAFLKAHFATFLGFGLLILECNRREWKCRELLFPLVSAAVFLMLSFQSPRAQEYMIPIILVGLGRLVIFWRQRQATLPFWVVFGVSVIGPMLAFPVASPWKLAETRNGGAPDSEWVAAVRDLPEVSPRIFNLEWDVSPIILYAKPDARIVDVLDPSFLVEHDRTLHDARVAIVRGAIVDVQGYIRDAFRADYLVTKNPDLRARFDSDPLLVRIFPMRDSKYSGPESMFQLNPAARRHFASRFEQVRGAEHLEIPSFASLRLDSPEFRDLNGFTPGAPVYVDLSKAFPRFEPNGDRMSCVSLSPSQEEASKWAGRTILGIGGGRNVRIWLNGKPWYHSITMGSTALPVYQLVDFRRPLKSSDRIGVLVCSRESAPVFGISLSWWTEEELSSLCDRKQWQPPETLQDNRAWEWVGRSRLSCIGDFARPVLRHL